MPGEAIFQTLRDYLSRIPSLSGTIGCGVFDDGRWWVKFAIDIEHPLAWRVVQELGHVLNYVSLDQRLTTVFVPVYPPPYMNGGPRNFLSWVIESKNEAFKPEMCAKWLEGRLPRPVGELEQWSMEEEG